MSSFRVLTEKLVRLGDLVEIIDNAAKPPAPDRRKSKPTRASIKRRLEGKRHASKKKESRRIDDW